MNVSANRTRNGVRWGTLALVVTVLLALLGCGTTTNRTTTAILTAATATEPATASLIVPTSTAIAPAQPTATATLPRTATPSPANAEEPLPPTTYPVDGAFASFWSQYGGLTRFGLPLSPAVVDPASNGLVVQYFERARFEVHPDAPPAYLVQLTLLGSAALGGRAERTTPAVPCSGDCDTFAATGHTLRDTFRRYWLAGGGLPVFGYPLTEQFHEVNAADGRDYIVQYFERARFELHPEYAGTPYEVLLGLLGREALAARPDVATLPHGTVPDYPAAMQQVIVLDPGHDRTTGGAMGVEYRDTLRTALAIAAALETRGYTVLLTRPDNTTVLVNDPALLPDNPAAYNADYREGYAHASKILALKPDLAISIHYNAAPSGPGGGSTTYYCDLGGPQNARLASILQQEIAAALRDRGYTPPYSQATEDAVIGKTYGHLATLGNVNDPAGQQLRNRMAGLPIVLTEALFETNPTERALIADDATIARLAEGYARAVDAYFGSKV
ncbi:MAG: N-acetylmuramoyl-L-alanine amidase [Thermomicrobiales bacterium]